MQMIPVSHLTTPSPLPTPCDHRKAALGGHQPPAFDPLSRPCPFPAIGSVTRKTPCGAALVDLVGLPKISGGGGPTLISGGVGGRISSGVGGRWASVVDPRVAGLAGADGWCARSGALSAIGGLLPTLMPSVASADDVVRKPSGSRGCLIVWGLGDKVLTCQCIQVVE
jgi:hypothetical protein